MSGVAEDPAALRHFHIELNVLVRTAVRVDAFNRLNGQRKRPFDSVDRQSFQRVSAHGVDRSDCAIDEIDDLDCCVLTPVVGEGDDADASEYSCSYCSDRIPLP
jgi:hypothetical protein